MVDLAELRITVNTSDVKRAEAATVTSAAAMGRAFDQTTAKIAAQSRFQQQLARDIQQTTTAAQKMDQVQRQATATASAYAASFERTYQRAIADIKEAQARGLLTPQEAQARGAAAAQAYNRGVLSQIDRLGGAGALSGNQGQALFVGLAGQLKDVDEAATRAGTGGLRTLNTGLANLAAQELGARSGLGSMAGAIGAFSLGTLTSLGVMAGLAAVGVLIGNLTEGSRKAEAELDAVIDRIQKLQDERFHSLAQDAQDLKEELQDANQKLAGLIANRDKLLSLPGGGFAASFTGFGDLIEKQRAKIQDLQSKVRTAETAAEQKAAADAKRALDERLSQLAVLRKAEFDLATARATTDTERTKIQDARRTLEIDEQVRGMEALTAAERERLRTTLQTIEAVNRLKDANKVANAEIGNQLQMVLALNPQIAALVEKLQKAADLQQQRALVTGRILLDPARFGDSITRSLGGGTTNVIGIHDGDPGEAGRAMAEALKMQMALMGVIKGVSGLRPEVEALIGPVLMVRKSLQGLKVDAESFALAAASLASSLITASRQRSQKKSDEFRAWVDAREGFGAKVDAFAAQGSQSSTDPALAALADQFRALKAEAERLQLPTDKLTAAYTQQKAAIEATLQSEVKSLQQSWEVRRLQAQGQTEAAEALQRRLAQEAEIADLVAKVGKDRADSLVQELTALQQLEEAARKAAADLQKANEALDKQVRLNDLVAAEADLSGDKRAGLIAGRDSSIARASQDFLNGRITSQEFDRWVAVFEGQLARSLQELADAAEAANQQLAATNLALQQDAALRILAAQAVISGSDADRRAYEDAKRLADQRRELDQATANGATEATRAAIAAAQVLEDQAVAAERARKATEELNAELQRQADLAKAQAASTQDLQVRLLRAQGFGTQADDLQRSIDQARELERFQGQGFDSGFQDFLRQVQAAETQRVLMDRAIAEVTAPAASATRVSPYGDETRGLLETNMAVFRSMDFHLAQIAQNTAGGYGASAVTVSVSAGAISPATDRALNRRAAVKQSAAGSYRPL